MKHPSEPQKATVPVTGLDIRLKEVELPVELARLGLQGTLVGALAGGALIVAIALIGAIFPEKVHITGEHLCILMSILALAITFMGSFVFQRSLSFGGNWGSNRVSLGTANGKTPAKQQARRKSKKGAKRSRRSAA